MPDGSDFQYPVNATGRLLQPEEFGDIVLRAQPDGSLLRIKDVGRIELGAETYKAFARSNGKPSTILVTFLSPGANAVETADRVTAFMESAKKDFPPGLAYKSIFDPTLFVRAAIRDVVETLFIAIGLVVLVVFLFLQSWRATLIPLLTVPVSILGTFALFPALGFSINMTSMFGLVLAIGIVVDDAIVVVEAGAAQSGRGHDRQGGHHQGHVGGVGSGGCYRRDSGRRLCAGRVPGRHLRPDLTPVCTHHRGVGSDFRLQRA